LTILERATNPGVAGSSPAGRAFHQGSRGVKPLSPHLVTQNYFSIIVFVQII